LSQGTHDGELETQDVLAALAWLEREYHRPIVVVGFSFGAAMTVKACCGQKQAHKNLRALAALGLPLHAPGREQDRYPSLENCTLPKLFLSGDRDKFAPAEELAQVVASAAEPKRLILIPGADHFFTGHLEPMRQALSGWLKEQMQ
jgi:alpha/beta superfamily hydrolase